ncbi:unnamed protein product [Anisakis simplex]|uniref:Steroidogenic acute regulatory-like protein 1 (inferred by orthology to a C. elegans protein) n=1 Tax=Anisakis simplex TaxID=6269 RepID=A0A0M3K0J8_ANISI|nr:unnamed protein product [Anisakis simplex]
MSTSYKIAGVVDVLQPAHQKYKDALYSAGQAMEDLIHICRSVQFETHEGWEKRASRKNFIVYSKLFPIGNVFTLRTEIEFPLEQIFREHWNNFEKTPQFNKNAAFAKRVVTLAPLADIIHYGLSEDIGVSARDFLAGRMTRRLGNEIFVAARSFEENSYESIKDSIRGNLVLGGARFRANQANPRNTIIDYVLCAELSGSDVSSEKNDQILMKFMIEDIECVKNQIQHIRVRVERKTRMGVAR